MPLDSAIAVCNLDARRNDTVMVVVQDKLHAGIYHVKPLWRVQPDQIVYTSGE